MSEKSEATTLSPLTLFAEGSPARTSATLASEQASKVNEVGFGQSSTESFANYDPDTCLWRTSERCLFGGWIEFSETWPMAGTMRNGIVFRRPPLVPRISDTVCSYSPSGTEQPPDAAAGILWPTPDATGSNTLENRHCYDRIRPTLGKAARMWPTPRTTGLDGGSNSRKAAKARGLWPTPKASDYKGTGPPGSKSQLHDQRKRNLKGCVDTTGGQLNPTWVELLMGFPPGWTDIED